MRFILVIFSLILIIQVITLKLNYFTQLRIKEILFFLFRIVNVQWFQLIQQHYHLAGVKWPKIWMHHTLYIHIHKWFVKIMIWHSVEHSKCLFLSLCCHQLNKNWFEIKLYIEIGIKEKKNLNKFFIHWE